MLFLNELITYVIKFIVLGGIAVVGVLCGAKYKKYKLAHPVQAQDTADEGATE